MRDLCMANMKQALFPAFSLWSTNSKLNGTQIFRKVNQQSKTHYHRLRLKKIIIIFILLWTIIHINLMRSVAMQQHLVQFSWSGTRCPSTRSTIFCAWRDASEKMSGASILTSRPSFSRTITSSTWNTVSRGESNASCATVLNWRCSFTDVGNASVHSTFLTM